MSAALSRSSILPLPVRPQNTNAVAYVCTTPEEGLAQLEILKQLGCKPHHRVLEIGCGAFVAGYPIMQYLEPDRYVGIDPNRWLADSSLDIPEVGLLAVKKGTHFYAHGNFHAGVDEDRFDFILAHSILSHASSAQFDDFLAAAKEQLTPGGTLAASLRLAEGNPFGSPGSARHGAAFIEWQYPGVSWFRREDALERARRAGLSAEIDPELTRTIMNGNPKAVHDWLRATPTKVTLVTAFFRLRDREVDEEELFRRFDWLASSGMPIILFLDKQLADRAPKHPNVRVVLRDLASLWPFAQTDRPMPTGTTPGKDTRDFLLLQNAKLDMLSIARGIDDSTHFAWIDFGIAKIVSHPRFLERLQGLRPPPTCVLAPGCWEKGAQSDGVNWRFCGGFLLVDRNSIASLVKSYHKAFKRSPTLTWEVNIWAAMEQAGQHFDWYKADHDDSIIDIPEPKPAPIVQGTRVCLCMIVKNESAVIRRCIASALPSIDCWAILDTGSTDGTPEIIEEALKNLPGKLARGSFKNFAQARNDALDAARELEGWDYALLLDADMVLAGVIDKASLGAPAYRLVQKNGMLDYSNTRLLRRDIPARYVGVTHEFLSVDVPVEMKDPVIIDLNDGGSRGDKAERDIRLLNEGLAVEPQNERYMFYLANTYRDTGRYVEAIQWYKRRIERGGWDEEVWASLYGIARSYKELDLEPEFIKAAIDAYSFRPHRGEPLKLLSQFWRERGKNDAAMMVAETLEKLPMSGDVLFVERDVYEWGAKQEIGICGFYSHTPGRREAGYKACAELTTCVSNYIRDEAKKNFTFYAKSAKELFGASTQKIEWDPGDGYHPMNPAVCIDSTGRRLVLVRTVNYTVTREGQYPTSDGSGIIKTRNWLVDMTPEWTVKKATQIEDRVEVLRSQFPVEGYEDCRLWENKGKLYLSATCRDLADNPEGQCEIVIGELEENQIVSLDAVRDYEHDRPQKNWMPILGNTQRFLYLCDPTIVIERRDGKTVEIARSRPKNIYLGDLRGGSQVIPWEDGWICLTHEVTWRPDRVYLHRFVRFDHDFRVTGISDPFYFEHVGIEFCAGLTWDAEKTALIASFGVEDASAHLAFFASATLGRELREVPIFQ